MPFTVRKKEERDAAWIRREMDERWGGNMIERAGEFIDALTLDAFVAEEKGEPLGLATILHTEKETEIVTISTVVQWRGMGTALLTAIIEDAQKNGSTKIKVFTSNDNLDALRFYQRRGFQLEKIWKDSITEARKTKPTIPFEGFYGLPIKDEIELHHNL